MNNIDQLIAKFPKTRPELPEALKKIYVDVYQHSREGKSLFFRLTQYLESWMHKKCAKYATPGQTVLELGAGTLNQLPWEPKGLEYDVVEPFHELFEGNEQAISRVRDFYDDIMDIPADRKYERIQSIAVLEHVTDLPKMLARSAQLLEEDGVFVAAIPSEGELGWGLTWRCSAAIAFKLRTGQSYKTLLQHEHINDAAEITDLCKHFFGKVSFKRFPLPFKHGSLYTVLVCRKPDLKNAAAMLEK